MTSTGYVRISKLDNIIQFNQISLLVSSNLYLDMYYRLSSILIYGHKLIQKKISYCRIETFFLFRRMDNKNAYL